MTELDQIWSRMLDEAAVRAGDSDRTHVAEYLRLKATNDAIRTAGVGWLFDTLIEIASRASRDHNTITIEREDPHSFYRGSSNMVGSLLEVRQGVRCLSVEAGWVRTPSDGIMQKGALAYARIRHFGMPKAAAEFRLVHAETLPSWLAEDDTAIDSREIRRHFRVFRGV
ncbi:MAG: hypothetical protein ABIP78_02800 [Pyrinomonadaceae bacterium]